MGKSDRRPLAEMLAAHYSSMNPWGPWKDKPTFENYTARPTARLVVQLDHEATQLLIEAHRGRNSQDPLYVLIHREGNLRGPVQKVGEHQDGETEYLTKRWDWAVSYALDEGLVIYNARSKKCSRPVWRDTLLAFERKLDALQLEPVKLVLQPRLVDGGTKSMRDKFID